MSTSNDFSSAVGNAAGKAAVNQASQKFSCKDINFKEPRTWGWILGIVSSCLLITAGLGAIFSLCALSGIFALVFGAALLLLEFWCCFKCCATTKDCATKGEKWVNNPFIKGGLYLAVAVIGIVITALICVDSTGASTALAWIYVLYAIACIAGICNIAFGFMERARQGNGGGGGGASGGGAKSTTYSDGAPAEPDFSQA